MTTTKNTTPNITAIRMTTVLMADCLCFCSPRAAKHAWCSQCKIEHITEREESTKGIAQSQWGSSHVSLQGDPVGGGLPPIYENWSPFKSAC